MPDLDRILSFDRIETRLVTPESDDDVTRSYNLIGETRAYEGIESGRIVPYMDRTRITESSLLNTATIVYLSTTDADGGQTPDDSNWPPDRLILGDANNSIDWKISAAEHPTYRDRNNRQQTATDTWCMTITDTTVIGDLTAIVFGAAKQVIFRYAAGEPEEVTGTVTNTVWADRMDPNAQRQLIERIGLIEVGVIETVWRIRGDGPVPEIDEQVTDDDGKSWDVLGISLSDERGRYASLLCRRVVGTAG